MKCIWVSLAGIFVVACAAPQVATNLELACTHTYFPKNYFSDADDCIAQEFLLRRFGEKPLWQSVADPKEDFAARFIWTPHQREAILVRIVEDRATNSATATVKRMRPYDERSGPSTSSASALTPRQLESIQKLFDGPTYWELGATINSTWAAPHADGFDEIIVTMHGDGWFIEAAHNDRYNAVARNSPQNGGFIYELGARFLRIAGVESGT